MGSAANQHCSGMCVPYISLPYDSDMFVVLLIEVGEYSSLSSFYLLKIATETET